MKRFFIFSFIVLCFGLTEMLAWPPWGGGVVTVDEENWLYRDNTIFTDRELIPVVSPCSCDCEQMVLPGMESSDNSAALFGGYEYGGLYCNKLALNISACNGLPINSFQITYDTPERRDCFDYDFTIYREKLDGTVELCEPAEFDPKTETGTFCFGNEPVPACSSRKVIFYICNPGTKCREGGNVTVHFDLSSAAPWCNNREMIFHIDMVPDVEEKVGVGMDETKQFELKLKSIEYRQSFNFRVFDLYGKIVKSGKANSLEELKTSLINENNPSGLYFIQYLINEQVIHQDKLLLVN